MSHELETELSLLDALKLFYPESSKRSLENWIKWGRVVVDGVPQQKANALLRKGQIVDLEKKEATQVVMGIHILYQDRWIIAIDKPEGLLSVPAEKVEHNALHLLKAGFKSHSILPIHRLDQETSGVLLFARSKMAEERFKFILEKRELERTYLALVEGHFPFSNGTWENYLRELENFSVEVTSEDQGKRAVTHYEVIHRSKKLSFLRLKLETGRKHQIRVQAAHAGFPLVGDKRYGSLFNPYKRLCLHAHTLSFIHPFTKQHLFLRSKSTYNNIRFPFPSVD